MGRIFQKLEANKWRAKMEELVREVQMEINITC
jgi:hypothetical protein